MTKELSAKRTSLSLGITTAIVSIACALLIAIAPEFTTKFLGAIFHGIDLTQIEKAMTLGGAIQGTIVAIVLALIVGWLFAVIYNTIKK